jgi:hypothetical protein
MTNIKEFSELEGFEMFGCDGSKAIRRDLRRAERNKISKVDPRTVVGSPERLAALAEIENRIHADMKAGVK